MKMYSTIILVMLLAFNLQAQVRMQYKKHLTGNLVVSDIAAIRVTNFTGVDIDYIYKGWAIDSSGKEVLRIKSEILTQEPGSANYHQNDQSKLREITEVAFKTIKESIDPSRFSGSLTLHSELVHPLDTTSIIAREKKEVILKNGAVVDAQGVLLIDPQLVGINFKHNFSQPFELDNLSVYLEINNKMGFSFCKPLNLKIKQEERELYAATIDPFCVREGKNSPEKGQWTVLKNDYDNRNIETPITVTFAFGAQVQNRTIKAVSHALYGDQLENYKSEALGISFDFVNHAEILSAPSPENTVIIFDEKGAVENIETLRYYRSESPLDLNYPYGFGVQRPDVNGSVRLSVYDYNNFDEEEWKSYLAYVNRVNAKDISLAKSSGIEIWYPPGLYNRRKESNRVVSYEIFTFAIRDGERVTFVELLNIVPDANLKNFPKPRIKIEKQAIVGSFNYHGLGISFKPDDSGNFTGVAFSDEAALADADYRKSSLAKYIRYEQILRDRYQNQPRYQSKPAKVNFRELDSLAGLKTMENLEIPLYQKITPDYDPVRKYGQFSWDSMQIAFTHRVSEEVDRIPFSNQVYESYTINSKDSILNHYQSAGPKNLSLKEGEREVAFLGNLLQLSTTPDQQITFTVIEKGRLSSRDMKAIAAYEMSNPVQGPPVILEKKVNAWTFYVSERQVNTGRRMGQTNLFFLETEQHLYRVKISGGFESDIPHFFNHLKIEGKKLKFEYSGGVLARITIN